MNTDRKDWTVLSMLKWATDYFEQRGIPDSRHSIEWLLAEVLDIKRLDLYVNFDRPLSPDELDRLRPLVKRRARHEPLQYITGSTEFMNAHLKVTPDVLIPRIETEQLVEIILADFSDEPTLSVLDLGTGSGCIPISIKIERPAWNVSALEISAEALAVARENAEANNTNIHFEKGDINKRDSLSFSAPFDVIVSNPPYILPDEKESLEPQVRDHEPGLALFCDDLVKMYQNIAHFSAKNLKPDGRLYLEINEHHAEEILSVFGPETWQAVLLKDYAKKPRFIRAVSTN